MLFCVSLLCVFVLANNASANRHGTNGIKESNGNNAMVKEWHSDGNGKLVNAGDLYYNETSIDDDGDDDDDKPEHSKITLGSRIRKGNFQSNMMQSPWAACIVPAKKMPVKQNVFCICSGSIIGRRHILTAAHCVRVCKRNKCRLRSTSYYVVVGHIRPRETKRFEKVKRLHFLQKPKGTTRSRVNKKHCFTDDIVVLELQETIPFGENIQKIQLPPPASFNSIIGTTSTTNLIKQNRFCQVYGWGRGGGTAAGLKSVISRLIDCDYPRIEPTSCPRTRICTLQYGDIGSPCQGDSGGPLVCDGVLHGQLTGHWGDCYSDSNRMVYQRVEVFVPWITRVISDHP